MTTEVSTPPQLPSGPIAEVDNRGSWIPTGPMIATRFMELRKRRGLMIVLSVVTVGIPGIFLLVRLLLHAFAPHSYGPAGGYTVFTALVAGVLYVFGFIVAATLGCTAGSADLTEGMFRHLVVTGRSRLAAYLARIPAGLAIIAPLVAIGYAIVCAVCVFAAPSTINYDGAHPPAGLSQSAFQSWAAAHPQETICHMPFNFNGNPPFDPGQICAGGPGFKTANGTASPAPTQAQLQSFAVQVAQQDYTDYHSVFRVPSTSLMIKAGLWIELEVAIGFIVGLGLSSLLGQRTVAVVLMIVLEIILTPIFERAHIPHLINLQRGVVGLAMAHIEPGSLPLAFGGGGPAGSHSEILPETTTTAVCVILGWLVVWTALGAWRMMTRDA